MLSLSRTVTRRHVISVTTSRAASTGWSQTLSLPKSKFPARASPQDLKQYRQRCADDIYQWQRQHRSQTPEDQFVLHDGPPYANGPVHVGHALNKILKDIILRWELARGKRVHYRPGWDCHGLPIELKALQDARSQPSRPQSTAAAPDGQGKEILQRPPMTAAEVRSRARKLAAKTIETQKESFREWGVMGEWEKPYRTMDLDFEIRQLHVFRDMVHKGLISRHHRPVYWSPSSCTALAEAELEYDDAHKCTAAFVKMPFATLPAVLELLPDIKREQLSALIWTTTPWTLPANKAIAVKHDIEYDIVELVDSSGKSLHGQILVASARIEHILQYAPVDATVRTIARGITGASLGSGGAACSNLFHGSLSPIVCADFVTASSGTGLVHMAPGHGMEDYQVCMERGVGPAFAPVDPEGKFTADVTRYETVFKLAGLDAQVEGVAAVLAHLRDPPRTDSTSAWNGGSLLLASHEFTHKNPIDWRTKKPVIVRATAQWFADVSAIRERALTSLNDITFIPETGRARLAAFVKGRSQWCISRQRAWGVPIPALYHKETDEACITPESIDHILAVMSERGTDAWFNDAEDESVWLHPSLENGVWKRGRDTMDVWFDSGTTWTSLESRVDRPLSDVYLEGTDQHRGWFQSSLLTKIAVENHMAAPLAPYSTLITHGFTLDADGRKMSKSLGNVIAPAEIIAGSLLPPLQAKKLRSKPSTHKDAPSNASKPQFDSMGPDALRLWVASSDYTRDVVVAIPALQEIHQALQKYRVTFKFLLGVLADYPESKPDSSLLQEQLSFADQVILRQLARCSHAVFHAYSEYQFHRAIKEINHLIANDLSAFYIEICKDRLYTDSQVVRRHTQTVLLGVLRELTQMLVPIVPHLVEEAWDHTPAQLREQHPLQRVWNGPYEPPFAQFSGADTVDAGLHHFDALSTATKSAQEDARRAGHLKSGLACRVVVRLAADAPPEFAEQVCSWSAGDELAEMLIVSQAEVATSDVDTTVFGRVDEEWRYEQPIVLDGRTVGVVEVASPSAAKCLRCWRYVAHDANQPCSRCQTVLAERSKS